MPHWKYRAQTGKTLLIYLHTGILSNCIPEKCNYKAGIQHFGPRTPQYNSASREHVLAVLDPGVTHLQQNCISATTTITS